MNSQGRMNSQELGMHVVAANREILWKLVVVAIAMFGFGFAMAPIYKRICETAGINKRDLPAVVANTQVDATRTLVIELDANTRGLPWDFRPLQKSIQAHPGELVQVMYEARNSSSARTTGQAIASYGPQYAAQYVHKLECFCFSTQQLEPYQTRQMPVQLVIARDLPADIKVITLSYTFFQLPAGKEPG
jgi:cytochrome c oxidase assembly protein subunit 11